MFTPEQFRTKAAEYSRLVKTANRPNEVREYQKLERSFAVLADNEQWLMDNQNKTVNGMEQGWDTEAMNAMKYGGTPENKPALPLFVRSRCAARVSSGSYCVLFSWKDIPMTNVKISASEPQKPADPTPAIPQQQTQSNLQKPAGKPGEQQK
jgi:hypothetical protein